uniref:Uncharacterized protein n=1 Tax=Glossina pallidipes TaxID=7398 RepID=A0A1A9ZR05_GLOPL
MNQTKPSNQAASQLLSQRASQPASQPANQPQQQQKQQPQPASSSHRNHSISETPITLIEQSDASASAFSWPQLITGRNSKSIKQKEKSRHMGVRR